MAATSFTFTSPSDRQALALARGSLSGHRRLFRALERHALAATDPHAAAGRAQLAIDIAVNSHPGLLVPTRLEQLLHELGRAHVGARPGTRPRSRTVRRVLHILTQAYEHGGHTRVAERWILADRRRVSNVLLTAQGTAPVPDTLQSAAAERGGALLGLAPGDLFARAWNLRALAAAHDLVVLHTHMHDVVPVLALAEPTGRPPTILFNHASHQLWVGVGIADVVANLQELDVRLSYERRGVAPGGSLLLPIPVTPQALPTRAQARAQLGIDPKARLILVVGSAWKLAPILEPPFTDLVREVLHAAPEARCLAVGPRPENAWSALQDDLNGRARALGTLPSPIVGSLMAAADVLLDTWPITGGATLLDAGFAGLPVVSPGDGRADLEMIRPGAGANGGAVIHAPSIDGVARTVAELLADDSHRSQLGERARAHVDSRHHTGWTATMEEIVDAAAARAGAAAPPAADPEPQATDWECVLQLAHDAAGDTLSPQDVLMRRAPDLPPDERPLTSVDAHARLEAILAAHAEPARRAVAAPQIEASAIASLLREVRALVDAGEIGSCAVAIAPAELSTAVSLFEPEMAAERALGEQELEIELIPASGVEAITRPGDRILAA